MATIQDQFFRTLDLMILDAAAWPAAWLSCTAHEQIEQHADVNEGTIYTSLLRLQQSSIASGGVSKTIGATG